MHLFTVAKPRSIFATIYPYSFFVKFLDWYCCLASSCVQAFSHKAKDIKASASVSSINLGDVCCENEQQSRTYLN